MELLACAVSAGLACSTLAAIAARYRRIASYRRHSSVEYSVSSIAAGESAACIVAAVSGGNSGILNFLWP